MIFSHTVVYVYETYIWSLVPVYIAIYISCFLGGQIDSHIVQTLTFSMGMSGQAPAAQHDSMATVCRVSRNVLFPPQFRTLHEWFHYAFSCSAIDGMFMF